MAKHRTTVRSRRPARGAVLVEACIVIATFVLMFLSMVFFRNMYLRKIATMRLARATVMAYSMQGCVEGQEPSQWASVDLDKSAGKNTPVPTSSPAPTGTAVVPYTSKTTSKRADSIMKEVPGAGSNGSTLNPIADLGFTLRAVAKTQSSLFGSRKGYAATMGSTSYVTCAEGIKDDDFKSVMKYALDKFSLTKSGCDTKKNGGTCNPSDEDP